MHLRVAQYEQAYSDALAAIAQGEERDATRSAIIDAYPSLSTSEVDDELTDALRDAVYQGVEREDIDPSWL